MDIPLMGVAIDVLLVVCGPPRILSRQRRNPASHWASQSPDGRQVIRLTVVKRAA
ncbi:hypothetical protein ABUW04_30535 [Streptacidiphilus sp. N1-10]|uniref:Uncharacterized protein n=1 Tax=Streptacidiphilus jeojiensis TaxID=3229225 RepID=A0ABV6XWF4_9ACTN